MIELGRQPMRASEIQAEELIGSPLRWTSVKAALAAGASGPTPRFRRMADERLELPRPVWSLLSD